MEFLEILGEKIRRKRKEAGLSQEELAAKTGYTSRSSINKIELGKVDLPQSKIKIIAQALNTTPAYLMGWDDELPHPSFRLVEKKRFAMIGTIACGEPIYADEDHEAYIDASAHINADFCLTAKGDSMMNAGIKEGDVVFIKKQSIVDNGQIAAVIIEDEATLKRVYYFPEQNKIVLSPENPKYPPMVFENEELDKIRIIGKAVCYMSNL